MVCKVALSSIFRGISITDEFIKSILGKPIIHDGKQIGIITRVEPETDKLYMDIDRRYKSQFENHRQYSFEIIDRYDFLDKI